jgi:hypothetical protein
MHFIKVNKDDRKGLCTRVIQLECDVGAELSPLST